MNNNPDRVQIDAESQEMIRSFVSEAFDSLDANEPMVEYLHQDDNAEHVNAIFRVFHTLKGLSGFFEMTVINRVTHEAETLLDVMRKQNQRQSEETISTIYSTFDFLRDLLQRVNTEWTDKSGEDEAEDMVVILRDAIERALSAPKELVIELDEPGARKPSEPAETPVKEEKAPDLPPFPEELINQYLTSAYELLESAANNLMALEKDPENYELIGEIFGSVHSLKGNSGFMGLGDVEELAAEMEAILHSIRSRELEVEQNIITILLGNCEYIRAGIDKLAASLRGFKGQEQPVEEPDNYPEEVPPPDETPIMPDIPEEVPPPAPVPEPDTGKPEARAKSTGAVSSQSFQQLQRKDIRVETSKIDKLFDLVGELITIESMVTKNPDLAGLNLPNFTKSASQLNKITRELQEITMSVRMMPLEGLFNKMKRLVRDVSLKMGKKVNLEISGQETEMDKNVIDEISDPLVHILRNSIDHGIESPEKRIAAGKPETGSLELRARYEGNEILIIVRDDGAGISREKALAKAEAKGLLTQAADKMTDKEIYSLIFEPGFSTAEKVTDISGRGVGLDVVKKNMEKLRGSIDVSSVAGSGSVFTLRIPLTLAIMEAMLIRVGEARYALPLLSVTESFRATNSSITQTMDGLEIVRVRDEVMPVVRLHEFFGDAPDSERLEDGILIILESREKKVCMFADEILGQQQAVIKGLSDYIGKTPGITGCMILGDGSIGLILDIESIISLSEVKLAV
ncbi:MAG: chemotaxis protein CheA [Chloroflexota bacterium]